MFAAAAASVVVCAAWAFVYEGRVEVNVPARVEVSASGFAYTKPVVVESDSEVDSREEAISRSIPASAVVEQPFDDLATISKAEALEVDLFPDSGVKKVHEAFPELSSNMRIEGDGDSIVLVFAGPLTEDAASKLSAEYYKPKFIDESRQWNVVLGAFDNVESAKGYAKSCAGYLRSSKITWAHRDDVLTGSFVKLRFFNLSREQNQAVRDFIEQKYSSVVPVLIRASKIN